MDISGSSKVAWMDSVGIHSTENGINIIRLRE